MPCYNECTKVWWHCQFSSILITNANPCSEFQTSEKNLHVVICPARNDNEIFCKSHPFVLKARTILRVKCNFKDTIKLLPFVYCCIPRNICICINAKSNTKPYMYNICQYIIVFTIISILKWFSVSSNSAIYSVMFTINDKHFSWQLVAYIFPDIRRQL